MCQCDVRQICFSMLFRMTFTLGLLTRTEMHYSPPPVYCYLSTVYSTLSSCPSSDSPPPSIGLLIFVVGVSASCTRKEKAQHTGQAGGWSVVYGVRPRTSGVGSIQWVPKIEMCNATKVTKGRDVPQSQYQPADSQALADCMRHTTPSPRHPRRSRVRFPAAPFCSLFWRQSSSSCTI
jgi:hypothetical protein